MNRYGRLLLLTLVVVVAALLVREWRLSRRRAALEQQAASPEGQIAAAHDRAQRWIIEGKPDQAQVELNQAWDQAQKLDRSAKNTAILIALSRQRASLAEQLGQSETALQALKSGFEWILNSPPTDEARRADALDFALRIARASSAVSEKALFLKQALNFTIKEAALVPLAVQTERLLRRAELQMALCLWRLNQNQAAEEQAQILIDRGPASHSTEDLIEQRSAIKDLVEQIQTKDRDQLALQWVQKEVELARLIPEDASRLIDSLMRSAEWAFKLDQKEEARKAEDEAILLAHTKAQPKDLVWALDRRGARFLQEKSYDLAMSDYNEAVELARKHQLSELWQLLARVSQCADALQQTEKAFDAAKESYDVALNLKSDPENDLSMSMAGIRYARQLWRKNEKSEALSIIDREIERSNKHGQDERSQQVLEILKRTQLKWREQVK